MLTNKKRPIRIAFYLFIGIKRVFDIILICVIFINRNVQTTHKYSRYCKAMIAKHGSLSTKSLLCNRSTSDLQSNLR